MADLVEAFLQRFLLPLVTGGELHVQRPLDAEDLARLEVEATLETAEGAAIHAARQQRAAALWPYPVATPLDRDTLALAVSLYDLLFLNHPGTASWWTSASSLERVEQFVASCLAQPVPRESEALVARHTLLAHLPVLSRLDVRVESWAARYLFQGMEPPPRMLRWRTVRRIHEQREEVTWLDSALSAGQQRLVAELFRQSPLTALLAPWRSRPTFAWLEVAPYLSTPALCRLVCNAYLAQGSARIGPGLARAFWELASPQSAAPPALRRQALRLAAQLVIHLYACWALAHGESDEALAGHAGQLLFRGAPEEQLASVLVAATRCGLLPSVEALGGQALHQRVTAWAEVAARDLGSQADGLATRLAVALHG